MLMPSSVYWRMRVLNFSHGYIIGLNDYVATLMDEFPTGITESDWNGIVSVLYNSSSNTQESVMEEFIAAYGIS